MAVKKALKSKKFKKSADLKTVKTSDQEVIKLTIVVRAGKKLQQSLRRLLGILQNLKKD